MKCIYCRSSLTKHPHHPTWWLCPRCDKRMFPKPPPTPKVDRRGEPSKPGG